MSSSDPRAATSALADAPNVAARHPQFAQALRLQAGGDPAAARQLYLGLIETPALTAACLHQLAVITSLRNEHERAAGLFRHALKLDPSNLRNYSSLANALSRCGNGAAALGVLLDQGCALQNAGRYADAEIPYREILSHDLLNYGAYVNLGTCLAQLHRLPEALQQLFRAMQLYGRLDKRVADFALALRERLADNIDVPLEAVLPPGLPNGRIEKIEDAITTLGKIMSEFCRPQEAVLCHRQSIALAPGFALAHWNLSLALLATGSHAEGWQEYEWRWHWEGFPGAQRRLPIQPWRGEPLSGQRVLVWAEQGFGDTLQFAPLVSRLAQMGAQVTFEVMTPLVRLLAQSFTDITVIEGPVQNQPALQGRDFDFGIANLSLPARLGLSAKSLPLATGYLKAAPDDIARWAPRLASNGRLRVGVVWAGRSKPDARRSIAFELMAPLFDRRVIKWYSLQVGPEQDDIPKGGNAAIDSLAAELTDFAETAAAMTHLDLIITIDTAAAHLAAALGKPVWLLLPRVSDWRWVETTAVSSWYPSLRIFRQASDGHWGSVIAAVGEALDCRTAQPVAAADSAQVSLWT